MRTLHRMVLFFLLCILLSGYVLAQQCSSFDEATGRCQSPDSDGDGFTDNFDTCPNVRDSRQLDSDEDGWGDACDNCPMVRNTNQRDSNNNGVGDACEPRSDCDPFQEVLGQCVGQDTDGDGITDNFDTCPAVADTSQLDSDEDGWGDACDNCPTVKNMDQGDTDRDGVGDACTPLPAQQTAENGDTGSAPTGDQGAEQEEEDSGGTEDTQPADTVAPEIRQEVQESEQRQQVTPEVGQIPGQQRTVGRVGEERGRRTMPVSTQRTEQRIKPAAEMEPAPAVFEQTPQPTNFVTVSQERGTGWWWIVLIFLLFVAMVCVKLYMGHHTESHSSTAIMQKNKAVVQYIQTQLKKGHDAEAIRQALLKQGWSDPIIQEAFAVIKRIR